ncbi:MAG: RNA polymerase subunit sigma-70 [Chloroflexi bacterium]|nr:MAG: RNA polymerase subunit sigma-70 [Chloroflexota bacterium]MBL1196990.1 sigma-70 family RNA polymerase sigma factor [Chloroflexota bacterium]NOH14285.1 RNA polymerase subunit sigma-70 [Chloroflexota bacterium]
MRDFNSETLNSQEDFTAHVETHRRELLVHCYRMMGSVLDAEDMLQETFLRAWQKRDSFRGTGTLRSWLYRIATNVCLDTLDKQKAPKRSLQHTDYPPADPNAPFAPPVMEPVWLEPFPDAWLPADEDSPEVRYTQQESIRLAFLTALQQLAPRQRAVLLMRDVLGLRAAETAEFLGDSVSSVNSALYRARQVLDEELGTNKGKSKTPEGELRALLERYVDAWQNADVDAFTALLREDALFTMPPSSTWYQGRENIGLAARNLLFLDAGLWRLEALELNDQAAYTLLQRTEGGAYVPFALMVLDVDDDAISGITVFTNPQIVNKLQ